MIEFPAIDSLPEISLTGRVSAVRGLMIECTGISFALSIGARCSVETRDRSLLITEVIGFREDSAILMPYGNLDGIGIGMPVKIANESSIIYPSASWLGRIINALGEPLDGKSLIPGSSPYPIKASPPAAMKRKRIGPKLDTGIRSINTFLSICEGQRMGIFSGSGVGKSTMMSMIAKYSSADVIVIGLIGERGREVQEFLEDDLGEEGIKRSVVVVATGDEPALMRRQAAYMTLAVAEYFRDQGKSVMCMMDSVTRFAMAQREIGLSAGEPPTTRGYTPSVFSELPKLLERAGPGTGAGSITGIFTVLVDGDDHNEPISDAVRGILDGHIILERSIAERGRFPAINILKSVSRTMPECNTDEQNHLVNVARSHLSIYDDMAEMIRLGAYRRGSNREVDDAIKYNPMLEAFLKQRHNEVSKLDDGYTQLRQILGIQPADNGEEQSQPQQQTQ